MTRLEGHTVDSCREVAMKDSLTLLHSEWNRVKKWQYLGLVLIYSIAVTNQKHFYDFCLLPWMTKPSQNGIYFKPIVFWWILLLLNVRRVHLSF